MTAAWLQGIAHYMYLHMCAERWLGPVSLYFLRRPTRSTRINLVKYYSDGIVFFLCVCVVYFRCTLSLHLECVCEVLAHALMKSPRSLCVCARARGHELSGV